MSFCAVVALLDSADRPTVKAAMRPACLTVDGYATLSLIVSNAVARVRMIVHCAGATPLGQLGATSGVVETPSSTVVAPARAGRAALSATAPARANKKRFMLRFNTKPRRQLRRARNSRRATPRTPAARRPETPAAPRHETQRGGAAPAGRAGRRAGASTRSLRAS